MRLLITGATGFAGNALLDLLPATIQPDGLTLFVLPGDPGRERLLARRIRGLRIVEGDITDSLAVQGAVAGHTHVIHLAGLISYWRRDLERLDRINRVGVENIVRGCISAGVQRLVHISSVGAVGFHRDGRLADETTPFNWPRGFHYMTTKRAGQQLVEAATKDRGLNAVILNPASMMGPGDPDPGSAHNQLYRNISSGPFFGCFSGGLAVTDVRDLAAIALKALHGGDPGESYLVVGSNVTYVEVVRQIGACMNGRVFPFRIPAVFLTAAGGAMELASAVTGRRPLLTSSYGRLSGWSGYYSNEKSVRAFRHEYIPLQKTIADACVWYLQAHGARQSAH
jgi:dihydroflavonol-4-reductase